MFSKNRYCRNLILIILVLILSGCKEEVKANMSYIPMTYDVDMSDYQGIDNIHCFRLIKLDEMIKLIKNGGSGIFYLGYKSCSYCQSICKYLNEAGMKAGINIYYIDCYDLDYPIFNPENESLYIDNLKDTLEIENGEYVIYTPQVFTVVNGEIKDSYITYKDFSISSPTNRQINKLIKTYLKMFKPFMD